MTSARALYAPALMAKLETTTRGRRSHEGSLEGGGRGVSVGSIVVEDVLAMAGSVAKSRVFTSELNWSSGRRARKGTWDAIRGKEGKCSAVLFFSARGSQARIAVGRCWVELMVKTESERESFTRFPGDGERMELDRLDVTANRLASRYLQKCSSIASPQEGLRTSQRSLFGYEILTINSKRKYRSRYALAISRWKYEDHHKNPTRSLP